MKDLPYPLADDRSSDFRESGAELVIEYGRKIREGDPSEDFFAAMLAEQEGECKSSDDIYKLQSRLFSFFREHPSLPLKRAMRASSDIVEIDLRIASVFAYLAALLVDFGRTSEKLFTIAKAVASVLPLETSVLEVRRVIASLVVNRFLDLADDNERVNPGIRLGDEFLMALLGRRCLPFLTKDAVDRVRREKADYRKAKSAEAEG